MTQHEKKNGNDMLCRVHLNVEMRRYSGYVLAGLPRASLQAEIFLITFSIDSPPATNWLPHCPLRIIHGFIFFTYLRCKTGSALPVKNHSVLALLIFPAAFIKLRKPLDTWAQEGLIYPHIVRGPRKSTHSPCTEQTSKRRIRLPKLQASEKNAVASIFRRVIWAATCCCLNTTSWQLCLLAGRGWVLRAETLSSSGLFWVARTHPSP